MKVVAGVDEGGCRGRGGGNSHGGGDHDNGSIGSSNLQLLNIKS